MPLVKRSGHMVSAFVDRYAAYEDLDYATLLQLGFTVLVHCNFSTLPFFTWKGIQSHLLHTPLGFFCTGDKLKFLIILPPKQWHHRSLELLAHMLSGTGPKVLCMLAQHPTDWAITPAFIPSCYHLSTPKWYYLWDAFFPQALGLEVTWSGFLVFRAISKDISIVLNHPAQDAVL